MGWSGYSHISGTQNRIGFLEEFRQHIHKGGPLLISFFTLPEDSYQFKLVYLTARIIRGLRFSREKVEKGDILLEMFFHYASQAEVQQEMAGWFRHALLFCEDVRTCRGNCRLAGWTLMGIDAIPQNESQTLNFIRLCLCSKWDNQAKDEATQLLQTGDLNWQEFLCEVYLPAWVRPYF